MSAQAPRLAAREEASCSALQQLHARSRCTVHLQCMQLEPAESSELQALVAPTEGKAPAQGGVPAEMDKTLLDASTEVGGAGAAYAPSVRVDGSSASIDALCMACADTSCDFKPMTLPRRPLGPSDVLIEMKYCGVCHSDLHHAAGHVNVGPMSAKYPCVPGHELAGVCVAVGSACTKIKVGMKVGVGCLVGGCLNCSACRAGEEQKCLKGTPTYGGDVPTVCNDTPAGMAASPTGYTLGGYTTKMVVNEHYGIIIPDSYPLEAAGPVMCAGITMYDPLIKLIAKGVGKRVGIAGLGGLGVMGIKLAKALGCTVTVISRSDAKKGFATSLGADSYLATGTPGELAAARNTLDIILNTIPVYHDYDQYTTLLAKGGKQVILGLHKGIVGAGIMGAVSGCCGGKLMASGIGGIKNTQAVVDLCAENNIVPELKIMPCEKLNEIYSMLDAGNDDGVRMVLDISNTLNAGTEAKCKDPAPRLGNPSGQISICGGLCEFFRLLCCCKCL